MSDSTMLIVTHSIDKQLRLYRVGIDFQQQRFSIQHLKSVSDCSPLDQDTNGSLMNIEMLYQLSHLAFIPHGPDTKNREPAPAFILGVFSYVPEDSQKNSMHQDPLTILARWELHSARPKLHSSFEQLTSKRPNSLAQDLLVRLPFCVALSPLINLVSLRYLSSV